LEVDRWRQALQSVVNRHDGLRTVFVEGEGTPYQQVLTEVKVEFVQMDWREESGEEEFSRSKARGQDREGEMRRRERDLLSAAFDFQRGPLFRSELWRVGEREHIFVFAFHHLILDGVYMAELFEQVGAAYTALREGKPAGGVELKMQYGDFAVGQEERLRQGRLEEHAAYWRRQLESPLPAMELPLDGEGRPTGSFELEVMERKIEREVWQGLRGMRKRYRTTVFRTVLAGLQVLMQRLTGEEELLLGVPFTTLPGAGVGLLGFFGHAVPVRARVEGRARFAEVLTAVNRQMREAEAHVEYPLCEAVKGMEINRDPHRPLFPVVISQIRRLHYSGGGLQLGMQGRQVQGGVYHLWLTVLEEQEGLTLAFFYNRELLAGKPIEQLADCMQHLLGSIAATPEARVCELEILTPAEKALVLDHYPAAATSNAESDRSLVTSIEERADDKPDAIAIVCEQDQLTYRELNQRANQMARWLRAQSIRPEDRVGILGSRGIGMLTTLLAVLKSGAAFVPLDPGLPDSRLQNILSRAELRMLATDQTLTERGVQLASSVTDAPQVISWAPDAPVVPNPNTWADQSVGNLASENHPRALAYVCFTSGSTGAPKGVMVEHKGLLNHLKAKIHVLNLDERDVVAQNASHSFDISVWQFLAALLVGGRVVVYPANSLALSGSLLPLVETDGVTILEVVPSLLELMLESAPAGIRLRKLRHLISNAETLSLALSRRWKEKFPHTSLINTYGATECSDDTTHYFVPDSNPTRRIAVGRSIAGARHYVVDRELRPLPSGFVGEIVIARDVVGRGYLQDPALTAATFVPDPFAQDGSRIYLTGDFGRWNAAGDLEFLGRADHQIKLHGHRVELGDVESTLLRYPGVRHVAVMLRGQSGSQSLVAYWVGDSGVDASSLRRFSRSELPPHMVPGEFVKLPSMPLLSNGKIDRAMLPEPGNMALTDFVPARDEVEYQIAKIWQEELGVAEVGVFDNFFERGGHSLKAVSLIHKLQNAFSVNLPLRTIFDHQTIDALSQLIRSAAHDKPGSPGGNTRLVALQAGDAAHLPLFLIHPHGGTVFCYQPLVNALGREIPVFGLQCRGLEDGEEPAESIPEMAVDYVSHIRLAQPRGPYQIAGWSFGGPVAYEVARQLECAGLEVRFLGIFDSAIPDDTHENLEYLRPLSERWEDFNLDMSVASFARWFFRIEEDGLEEVSESQALDRLRDMAQRRGMLPPDVSAEMLRRFMGVAIRNAIAFYQYRPESRVRTDVVLFRASQSLVEDPEVWQPWTEGRVHAITTSGTHYDMVFPPAVHVVAEALKQRLEVSRPIESRI
ncbi:MAG TPA: amino acid adenylation domain-containing protein, partial [Candidatus Polarisedimenticolia bacterium]|nr:amino acid adenylation domain-containing protein [Candidatus Polarisedimenticolia bacterium]